jgi:hypothetical protein
MKINNEKIIKDMTNLITMIVHEKVISRRHVKNTNIEKNSGIDINMQNMRNTPQYPMKKLLNMDSLISLTLTPEQILAKEMIKKDVEKQIAITP